MLIGKIEDAVTWVFQLKAEEEFESNEEVEMEQHKTNEETVSMMKLSYLNCNLFSFWCQ